MEKTRIDEVLILLNNYEKTVKAICIDHCYADGMELEMQAAFDGLKDGVKDIKDDFDTFNETDFDKCVSSLRSIKEIDSDNIISNDLLELLEEEEVIDYVKEKYTVIKVNNLADQMLLEDILSKENFISLEMV